ncbi:MAG: hypothetical protein JJU36_11885 [Phycisphaeraceae bacterium]|nr:hypothetical protein [Phycisphaeraceae bacterium]
MSESQDKPAAAEEHICPMCGGNIAFDSPVVRATQKHIRLVAAMIPLGVILAAGGKLLAAFTTVDAWGHGIMGFGIAVALLSAVYIKAMD